MAHRQLRQATRPHAGGSARRTARQRVSRQSARTWHPLDPRRRLRPGHAPHGLHEPCHQPGHPGGRRPRLPRLRALAARPLPCGAGGLRGHPGLDAGPRDRAGHPSGPAGGGRRERRWRACRGHLPLGARPWHGKRGLPDAHLPHAGLRGHAFFGPQPRTRVEHAAQPPGMVSLSAGAGPQHARAALRLPREGLHAARRPKRPRGHAALLHLRGRRRALPRRDAGLRAGSPRGRRPRRLRHLPRLVPRL